MNFSPQWVHNSCLEDCTTGWSWNSDSTTAKDLQRLDKAVLECLVQLVPHFPICKNIHKYMNNLIRLIQFKAI